ncbi:hypothetical protein PV326_005567 [Microctonus aethiopoides]|nr:hypothetical protein PV326_005567 [Microctonus aethiopoides]
MSATTTSSVVEQPTESSSSRHLMNNHDSEDVETLLDEKNRLITRQYAEIERLQRELSEVIGERDALICDVSKFKFELEMGDLKRLHDDREVDRIDIVSR